MSQHEDNLLSPDFLSCKQFKSVDSFFHTLCQKLDSLPIDDYQVDYHFNQSYEMNTRFEKVESLEFQEDLSFSVVLYKEQKSTSVQCHGLDLQQSLSLIQRSIEYLEYIDSDPCVGLEQGYDYSKDLIIPNKFYPASLSSQQLKDLIVQTESLALQDSSIVNSEGAYGQVSYTLNGHRNSRGLELKIPQSYYSSGVTVVASGGDDQREVDSSYSGAMDFSCLKTPEQLAQQAIERVVSKLHKRSIPSGNYPVVMSPRGSSHIIRTLLRAISGQAQYKKSSFLLDSLGKIVLPTWVDVKHNPFMEGAHYSYPVDADGLESKSRSLVTEGVLRDYILSVYSARRLGLTSNHMAGGVKNLTMSTNAQDLNDIVGKFPRCIVVDEVMGTGINIVNGDYSMGINGAFYEEGVRQFPLKETTIAGNLTSMLTDIVFHAGDFFSEKNLQIGTLAISSMQVSSS